jgi:hypothetical protein
MFKVPNEFRMRHGNMRSNDDYGNNGVFIVHLNGVAVTCIASDTDGWEHVSMSIPSRSPTYDEMERIKTVFWGNNPVVVIFMRHRPKNDLYVETRVGLWRNIAGDLTAIPPEKLWK